MKFGVLDHLDSSGRPLGEFYEHRLTLVEAYERNYWTTDPATLDELRAAGHELEDRLEGVGQEAYLEAAE